MCYGCTMCNKCGKYDWLVSLGKRRCPHCKKEPPPEAVICPDCGAKLPPPFPGPYPLHKKEKEVRNELLPHKYTDDGV